MHVERGIHGKYVVLGVLLLVIVGLNGCRDNGTTETDNRPEITSISPAMGPPGITVTIDGTGFSKTAADNKVTFNGVRGEVSSASTSSIKATVPKEAISGAVSVIVRGQTAVGPNFTVAEQMPGITAVEPDSGTAGTQVTITGMNFSSTSSENIITFNGGVIAKVQQASESELVTSVPEGARSGPIQVETSGQKTLSPSFKVITTGILKATISTDASGLSTQDIDPDGYALTIDARDEFSTYLIDTVYVSGLEMGSHQAELTDIVANCQVVDNNIHPFDITAGDTTEINYEVSCEKVKQQFLFISNRTAYDEIYRMDIACCDPPVRLTDDRFDKGNMTISTDRNLIAYEAIDEFSNIFTVRTDGSSAPKQVTPNGGEDPAFSPDGSQIAFNGPNGLTVVHADGSGSPVYLTSASMSGINLDWSPDGSQIVFQSNTVIYVTNADGSGSPDSLTAGHDPDWSPTSDQITYWGFDADDSEIFIINADGSGSPVKLTDNTSISEGNPSWSPDGSQIAFERDNGGVFDIFLVNGDGSGTPTNLTDDPRDNRNPVWSPDGSQIMFEMGDGNLNIYLINIDGTNLTQLTRHADRDENPLWGDFR